MRFTKFHTKQSFNSFFFAWGISEGESSLLMDAYYFDRESHCRVSERNAAFCSDLHGTWRRYPSELKLWRNLSYAWFHTAKHHDLTEFTTEIQPKVVICKKIKKTSVWTEVLERPLMCMISRYDAWCVRLVTTVISQEKIQPYVVIWEEREGNIRSSWITREAPRLLDFTVRCIMAGLISQAKYSLTWWFKRKTKKTSVWAEVLKNPNLHKISRKFLAKPSRYAGLRLRNQSSRNAS